MKIGFVDYSHEERNRILSDRILDTKMTKKRGLRIAFRVRVFFYYRSFSIRMQRKVSPSIGVGSVTMKPSFW